jgi:hypothetical protein
MGLASFSPAQLIVVIVDRFVFLVLLILINFGGNLPGGFQMGLLRRFGTDGAQRNQLIKFYGFTLRTLRRRRRGQNEIFEVVPAFPAFIFINGHCSLLLLSDLNPQSIQIAELNHAGSFGPFNPCA